MKYALTLLLFLASQAHVLADNIAYTIVGHLPGGLAGSTMGTGNAAFTLSFSLPAKPGSVSAGINGSAFSTIATDAVFSSGSSTSLLQNTQIGFYSEAMGGGMFARLFNGTDLLNFSLGGPALFSGTAANPTLLAGVFTIDPGAYSGVGLNKRYDAITHGFSTTTTVMARVVGVPEPGETLLSGTAVTLALLAGAMLRRARAS